MYRSYRYYRIDTLLYKQNLVFVNIYLIVIIELPQRVTIKQSVINLIRENNCILTLIFPLFKDLNCIKF